MAVFSKLVTTEKGLALIAKMLSDESKIVFTKVCTSDMEYALEDLEQLEVLAGIKQEGSISKVSRTSGAAVKVETVFTNTELTEGYYMRTVALYAQDSEGSEILYAAAIETSGNCYMPAFGGVTVSGAYIQLVTTVSNAENVTVEVDNSVFATIGNIMDLQQQIDTVAELNSNMAAAINTNAAKLELLERIGSRVVTQEIKENIQCTHSNVFQVCQFSRNELGATDDKRYYLYVLRGNFTIVNLTDAYTEIYEGTVYVNMAIGTGVGANWGMWLPIARGQKGVYVTAPVSIVGVGGIPSLSDGLKVSIQPFLYKQNESKTSVDVEESFGLATQDMYMEVYTLGGILSTIGGSGTVEDGGSGGTSNYNLLSNKPSINNVELKGNLTSDQLGLQGGSGESTEMIYEETLAALNGEEETVNE